MAFLTSESQKAWNLVKGLGMRLKSVDEAQKEVKDKIFLEVATHEMLASDFNLKLTKAITELNKTRRELELAQQRADAMLMEVEATRPEAEQVREVVA